MSQNSNEEGCVAITCSLIVVVMIICMAIFGKGPGDTSQNSIPHNPSPKTEDDCVKGFMIPLFETGKCILENRGYKNVERHTAFGWPWYCGDHYNSSGFEAIDPSGKKVFGNVCRKKKGLFRPVTIEFHEE